LAVIRFQQPDGENASDEAGCSGDYDHAAKVGRARHVAAVVRTKPGNIRYLCGVI